MAVDVPKTWAARVSDRQLVVSGFSVIAALPLLAPAEHRSCGRYPRKSLRSISPSCDGGLSLSTSRTSSNAGCRMEEADLTIDLFRINQNIVRLFGAVIRLKINIIGKDMCIIRQLN